MNTPQSELDRVIMEQQELNALKADFKKKLQDKFDESKFDDDMIHGADITDRDIERYIKRDDFDKDDQQKGQNSKDQFQGEGLSYQLEYKDGVYRAHGQNGRTIESKNLDDLNRKIAKTFKLNGYKNHREAVCRFTSTANPESETYKHETEAFARNFIKEGVTIMGDVPTDPEFWNKTRAEYLSNAEHTRETWDKMTRFVPREYMQSESEKAQGHSNNQNQISPAMMQRVQARGGR